MREICIKNVYSMLITWAQLSGWKVLTWWGVVDKSGATWEENLIV